MNKYILPIMVVILLGLTGCGHETVPQGAKGKVLDRGGFQPEVYPPSRVNTGMFGHLVLVDTTTQTINEPITIRMKDDMNLGVQIRFQLRMGTQPNSLNAVFNDIKPGDGQLITLMQVYNTYGKMIVNKVAREILTEYNINEVQQNFKKISSDIYNQITEEFKPTPLSISNVALGKLDYPDVIDAAILGAASRELSIKQAEADILVELAKMKGKERVADGNYRIKMKEAKRIRDYNKMIGDGVTPALLKLRELEVQEALVNAISENDVTTVFIPYGAVNSSGAQMRMYQK